MRIWRAWMWWWMRKRRGVSIGGRCITFAVRSAARSSARSRRSISSSTGVSPVFVLDHGRDARATLMRRHHLADREDRQQERHGHAADDQTHDDDHDRLDVAREVGDLFLELDL